MKRILVDMSCSILHHGHVRLLQKASMLGDVIVALTTDEQIEMKKGYKPELNFEARKELISAIRYVNEVIPSDWLIDDNFIIENNIDVLVHGDDNSNDISACEVKIYPRTEGVSSSEIRRRSLENCSHSNPKSTCS